MKIRGNTVGTPMAVPDWNQTNPNKADYIKNKPEDRLLPEAYGDGAGCILLLIEDKWCVVDVTSVIIPGEAGVGISKVEQTKISTESGGENVITITLTNGSKIPISLYNGGEGKPGKNGVSATHSWSGTILTVTSASGTSSADLKGADGNDGKNYVLTDADKTQIANIVATQLGGQPVYGIVGENKVVTLHGNVAFDEYTFGYMENGEFVKIGKGEYEPDTPAEPKNFADPSSSDWETNARLATGYGYSKAFDGHILTNYIPCNVGDELVIEGLNPFGISGTTPSTLGFYTSTDKSADSTGKYNSYLGFVATSNKIDTSSDGVKQDITVSGNVYSYTIAMRNGVQHSGLTATAFVRVSAPLTSGYTANDVVIKVKRNGEYLTQ